MSGQSRAATPSHQVGDRVPFQRIPMAWLEVAIESVIANVLLRVGAVSGLGLPAAFPSFSFQAIGAFTIVGVTGATVAFALAARASAHPMTAYTRVEIVALALSLLPNVAMALGAFPSDAFPGAGPATALALAAMHVATAAITLSVFTRASRAS